MNEPRLKTRAFELCLGFALAGCVAADCLAQSSISLPAIATNKVATALTWTAPKGITNFIVYSGKARNAWTNRITIATNYTLILPGVAYGIAALSNTVEGLIAYWPSNRIGEIRLKERGKTNFTVLQKFTNSPPEAVKLWEVVNLTTGWQ